MVQQFISRKPFKLENGDVIPAVTVAYSTYGKLNAGKTNAIWICHALTANSEVKDWWPGVVGENCAIDPSQYFIVCANILGSCYGSSGPLSVDVKKGKPYYNDFPLISIRDMVKAHILLRSYLDIDTIHLLIGGSMGGYQALEWCVMEPQVIQQLFLLATSATESAWGIAVHTAQRLAIEADISWEDKSDGAGQKGLKAARAIGMLTYRNYSIMVQQQSDEDVNKTDNYKASRYITYQGDKLVNRFNTVSYWILTKAMDSHHIARGRGRSTAEILQSFNQRTLIIGISSDILCPLNEQYFLAEHIPAATLIEIDSDYGHDGFMVESTIISKHLASFLQSDVTAKK